MTTTYRIAPLGGTESADQETCWAMNVKSWIITRLNATKFLTGLISLRGAAFAGEQAVRQVEVTTDSGRTWAPARLLDPDLGRGAWRQFEFTFAATPGNHTLASRATDEAGNTQPEQGGANLRGHRANGWRGPAIDVVVS
jgi:sulfite oxidase